MPAPKESKRDLTMRKMVPFHPEGIVDRPFVDRMDEGKDKFLALCHLSAQEVTCPVFDAVIEGQRYRG